MKRLIHTAVVLTTLLVNSIGAQTIPQTLDALFASTGLNGNVLVAENGRILYERSFGFADVARKIPNTEESAFQTASMSKIFTSTAILQLRDKGRLKLDDAVVKYLPDFPFPNITVRHLLAHTSGLPDLEMYERLVMQNPELVITNKDVIPTLKLWNKPLKFNPGDKWNYCNTNYALLALLIEKVVNMPFREYLRTKIFVPAKMDNTYVRPGDPPSRSTPVINHILATMYKTIPENVETVRLKDRVRMRRIKYETYNLGATVGDQNVISTTRDLLRFDEALREGKLVDRKSLDEAFTPVRLNSGEVHYEDFGPQYGKCSYGLGWIICDSPETGKTVSHDGFNRGIATQFYRNLTKKQTVVMFDNTEGAAFNQKVAAVIAILNGKPAELKIKKSVARHFGGLLLDQGPAAALIRFNEMRGNVEFYLDEREMNLLGYEFLFNDYKPESLEAFRLNVILFPESFNVYDSYAEALAESGKKAEAILMYRKAIALNPKSEGSIQALKQLEQDK